MTEGWAQTGQVVGTQNDGGREGREEAGGVEVMVVEAEGAETSSW